MRQFAGAAALTEQPLGDRAVQFQLMQVLCGENSMQGSYGVTDLKAAIFRNHTVQRGPDEVRARA